ncbi:unnamed protein product [Ascophyllum nodosum]
MQGVQRDFSSRWERVPVPMASRTLWRQAGAVPPRSSRRSRRDPSRRQSQARDTARDVRPVLLLPAERGADFRGVRGRGEGRGAPAREDRFALLHQYPPVLRSGRGVPRFPSVRPRPRVLGLREEVQQHVLGLVRRGSLGAFEAWRLRGGCYGCGRDRDGLAICQCRDGGWAEREELHRGRRRRKREWDASPAGAHGRLPLRAVRRKSEARRRFREALWPLRH